MADALAAAEQEAAEDSLFGDLEVPESAVDGIPRIDSDLTPDEKQEFVALLNKYMPLEQRALQLIKLARMVDTKRAPVGLRALQEISLLTGLRSERPSQTAPMFQLPPNTQVQVTIAKVSK